MGHSFDLGHDDRVVSLLVDERGGMLRVIEPITGEVHAEHRLVAPGEVSIVDAHYDRPCPTTPRRGARPRTPAEREFLALGPVDERFMTGAAAVGVTKLGTEIAEGLTLGAAHGTDALLDALERAVSFGRWRADDVRSILATKGTAPDPHPPVRLLEEAGMPPGVINMLPGDGLEVSKVALASPDLAGIHFTGSTPTFQHLWREVGNNIESYRAYPRIVGETGGKDFIVAHPSGDPGVVRTATIRGAFEFQGQKCSAASRAYVARSVWRTRSSPRSRRSPSVTRRTSPWSRVRSSWVR
jgi:hypothetical protein